MKGYIHSIETFGTVDGPGVRFVAFFAGCPMRCLYCHNPDTWDMGSGTAYTAAELLEKMTRNRPFYETGGITATGGEPLLQREFLEELFTLAEAQGIHTCLDTSGILFDPAHPEELDGLLAVTDLVMLDIKHMDDETHKRLTGHSNRNVLCFAKHLDQKSIPLRIRYVLVPGLTDGEEALRGLGKFLSRLSRAVEVEVLPYHTLGKAKYENLGIPYPLGDTPQASEEEARQALAIIKGEM